MRTKCFKPLFAIIAIALAASISTPILADEQPKDSPKTPSRIDIYRTALEREPERILTEYVEAYYDSEQMVIELTCHGLGSTEVYIVDSFGSVVTARTFNSDYEPFILLDAPTLPGTYCLVIIADGYYGEGIFSIN